MQAKKSPEGQVAARQGGVKRAGLIFMDSVCLNS